MPDRASSVQLKDVAENTINPATEEKQDAIIASLSSNTLDGDGTAGQVELTLANTWYAVPGVVPSAAYLLTVSRETVAGTLRYSFSNSSTPSSTFGNKLSSVGFIG